MSIKGIIGITSALLLSVTLMAAEEIKLEGIKCVVAKNNPAKAANAVEHKGGKVFFCCKNCPKKFAEDPEKFAARANYQLVATKQAEQAKCPISGRELNPDTAIKVSGAEVAFCCNNCKGKVAKAEADEQIVLVFSEEAWKKAGFEVKKDKKDEEQKN